MKIIPNKGYLHVEVASSDTMAPQQYLYRVVAVAEDAPLCKVGDVVLLSGLVISSHGIAIAEEDAVLAWAEGNDDQL